MLYGMLVAVGDRFIDPGLIVHVEGFRQTGHEENLMRYITRFRLYFSISPAAWGRMPQ